jgi:hypothetical protein
MMMMLLERLGFKGCLVSQKAKGILDHNSGMDMLSLIMFIVELCKGTMDGWMDYVAPRQRAPTFCTIHWKVS